MRAVDDADQDDDAEIGIIPAIDEKRLQRRRLVALAAAAGAERSLPSTSSTPEPGLRRNQHGMRGIEADHFLDLLLDALGLGRRQVDLVEDGHDFMAGIERVIDIGERLRLDALARIDDEERAFAGRERTRDFIGEVDMAGRIHQIQRYRSCRPGALYSSRTVCALMVMPRSRSISIESSTCSTMSRSATRAGHLDQIGRRASICRGRYGR